MKSKIALLMLLSVLVLAGWGHTKLEGNMSLLNQDKEEITFPQEKPTLFFFHNHVHLKSLLTAAGSVT